ncbi:urea ABC transporter ATP-binding subunit UrtE (plasmid) [Tistrella bauzanensis]|uniref:Urea ABC transporter ATP-binding subunit UrtE n=1 Tax=Tistrella arctica TaxID=3133430 RepID=A0ABU9YNZ9_9PROT
MLTVDDLTVAYGQSEVLHGLSLSAAKGEIVAIMGRNGMGKTTLMKSLIGILPTRGGRIRLGDTQLAGTEPYERVRHGLAFVPQGRMIFPALTVEENIRTGLVARGRTRIPDDIFSLFPVLHEMRRRRGGNLSGGQQQQLAIARALVAEPSVLLLDEPTEGIQPSIIKDMARSLREIRDMMNLTILVSEQVLSFALDTADRFLVIENGRLVHEDRRDAVNEARISAYLSV